MFLGNFVISIRGDSYRLITHRLYTPIPSPPIGDDYGSWLDCSWVLCSLERVLAEMFEEYWVDFTMSVVPTPLTFFEVGEELFLTDAAEF